MSSDKKQIEVKLYGGVAHGQVHTLTPDGLGVGRIEVLARDLPEFRLRPFAMWDMDIAAAGPMFRGYPIETATYYVREFRQFGVTAARSRVLKRLWVGVWENGALLQRDEYEMSHDIMCRPWEWLKKPTLLWGDLDQWMEYTMAEIGYKVPHVMF